MKNKKSMILSLIIGVVVVILVIVILRNLFGSTKAEASDSVIGSSDFDGDGIINYFDKCRCVYGETDNGCPTGTPVDDDNFCQYETCPCEVVPEWAKRAGCPAGCQ